MRGRTNILMYRARNYREMPGEASANPSRATRAQAISWTAEGRPDFGVPVADERCAIPVE